MGDSSQTAGGTLPRRSRWLTPGKRWLFRGLAVLLAAGVVEVVSCLIWIAFPPIHRIDYQAHLDGVARIGTERRNDLEVLHPYLGWVLNPEAAEVPEEDRKRIPVNSLGFIDTAPSVVRRTPDRFVIAIFGGSVAQQMSTIGEQAFRDKLSASPALRGREIHIVRLAMSGYKQPQQLMSLNYIQVLGGEFDYVVNIDGYNETGLAIGENALTHGVFAAYPRSWEARLQDVVDPRNSSISYRLLQIRGTRQARAQLLKSSFLRWTSTASLIWAAQDRQMNIAQVELGAELMNRFMTVGHGFARHGPKQLYSDEEGMYEHVVNLWKNSSRQMHTLCVAQGTRYLHVLQPNQYHANSKQLTEYEEHFCYAVDQEHAQAVVHGYPRLIAAGTKLNDEGIAFLDLTQLFVNETETIYSDWFCHYNTRGTNMLAEAVAAKVAESLANQ